MKKACQTLKDSTNVLWSLEGQVIQNGPIKTSKSDWPLKQKRSFRPRFAPVRP